MLFQILRSGDIREALLMLILTIPAVIVSLSFHEFAHGFAAKKLGDPTAYNMGRLTLNPLAHLDPIGALLMLVAGFGYAKPVPIDTRYFKNPKYGMAITAIAGPLMNLCLGLVATVLMFFFEFFAWRLMGNIVIYAVYLVLLYFAFLNFSLAIFNMIPLPPFDGSRVLFAFLPDKYYFGIMKYERYIMIAVLALLATDLFPFSTGDLAFAIIDGIYKLLGAIVL